MAKKKRKAQETPGKQYRVNTNIRSKELLVLDEEGEKLGFMSRDDAVDKAKAQGLDLIEVSPNAKPPVAKIMDYGKMLYNAAKAEKKTKKSVAQTQLKTVRITYNMEDHDLQVRANQCRKFLEKGNKVKVQMQMRGRQLAHADLGKEKMLDFFASVSDIAKMDGEIARQGNSWLMNLQKAE